MYPSHFFFRSGSTIVSTEHAQPLNLLNILMPSYFINLVSYFIRLTSSTPVGFRSAVAGCPALAISSRVHSIQLVIKNIPTRTYLCPQPSKRSVSAPIRFGIIGPTRVNTATLRHCGGIGV